MPTCPECGADVDSSDQFCTACGASLEGVEFDETAQTGDGRFAMEGDPFDTDVFEFAFKYPLANGLKPVAIGVLLTLLSFLVIPYLMFFGYTYRVGRAAALGRASPPEAEDFWGLLADGFRISVAVGIVLIPLAIVYVALLLSDRVLLANLIYIPMLLVVSAISPVFFGTGSVRGVYSDFRFLRFLTTSNFWIGLAYQLGITVLSYVVVVVLTLVFLFTIVGIPVALLLLLVFPVYFTLLQAALWGRIYHDAVEEGAVDPVQRPDEIESRW